jgi:Sugar (and other) transporter
MNSLQLTQMTKRRPSLKGGAQSQWLTVLSSSSSEPLTHLLLGHFLSFSQAPPVRRVLLEPLSTATILFCKFIICVAVPPVIESIVYSTYAFLACFYFLAGVVSFFLFPKTASKTLEEVEAVFEDASAHEEICVTGKRPSTRGGGVRYISLAMALLYGKWKVNTRADSVLLLHRCAMTKYNTV